MTYRVTLEATPSGVAYVNDWFDTRTYNQNYGTETYIYTYPSNDNYKFMYWELNGEVYSRHSSFSYRVTQQDVKFIARYSYSPNNPEDPKAIFKRRVYWKTEPEGVAFFGFQSGQKYEIGSIISTWEYDRKWGYEFKGWYENDSLVSNDLMLDYRVPDHDVTLVARYEFDPENPEDPSTFYSKSCEFIVEPNDFEKGQVTVEGLEKGRAIYGSRLILRATPLADNTFVGWYMGDKLLSKNAKYYYTVPKESSRQYIVAYFMCHPHNLIYKLNGEEYGNFFIETGDSIKPLADIVKDGYYFSGWQGLPLVMPDTDVVVIGSLALSSIRISQQDIRLEGGEKQQLKVYAGVNGMEEVSNVNWHIDMPNIASVSNEGIIKGLRRGTATVTAFITDSTQISASSTVEVMSDNTMVELPHVPFEFNFNAENYDVNNHRIANDLEAVLGTSCLQLSNSIPEYVDGNHLSISKRCEGFIDRWDKGAAESGKYFRRSKLDSLTVICKVSPRNDNSSNRSDLICNNSPTVPNYSLRVGYKNSIYLTGRSLYNDRHLDYSDDSSQIFAVRVTVSGVHIQNITTGESILIDKMSWGVNATSMQFFYSDIDNYFVGDFYWAYLSKSILSDREVWDVIDYNNHVRTGDTPDVLMGDADNNGTVDEADASTVADYILGHYPKKFNFKASDVNFTGNINVADIAGITGIMNGSQTQQPDTSQVDLNGYSVGISSTPIVPGGEGYLIINVINEDIISAVEMNLELPQGFTVLGTELDADRGENMRLCCGDIDGKYRILAYSLDKEGIAVNDGRLLTVKIKAPDDKDTPSFDFSLTDVLFSANGNEINVRPMTQNILSHIGDIPAIGSSVRVFDLLGREISVDAMQRGAYIIQESGNDGSVKIYKMIR